MLQDTASAVNISDMKSRIQLRNIKYTDYSMFPYSLHSPFMDL